MLKLIFNPDEFFSELKGRDVKIRVPLLTFVLPFAVILSGYQYFIVNKLSQAFPEELSKFFLIGAYVGVIATFIGVFAAWLIFAVILHGLSSFFGGKGNFRRTFEFTGYGFLPPLIGSLITVPMSCHYISKAQVPTISISQLQQNPNIVKSVISAMYPKNLVYSNLIINLAVTIWSLTIWTFAIKHAREIELRKAFICALIPTVLFTVIQIWKLLQLL
jgi:hypothetical protein